MTRTILFTTRSADANPMYTKFRDKFSYQGTTIGDFMRQQAKKEGFSAQSAKKQSAVYRDTTAENRITKANSLPRERAAAPASDCISCTNTGCPKMFFLPAADHSSTYSAIVDDGVIGYIAATSLNIYAICAAA